MKFLPESRRARRITATAAAAFTVALFASMAPETTTASPKPPTDTVRFVGGGCLSDTVTVLDNNTVRASVTYLPNARNMTVPGSLQLGLADRSTAEPDTITRRGDQLTATADFTVADMDQIGVHFPIKKSYGVLVDALPTKGGGDDGIHCGQADVTEGFPFSTGTTGNSPLFFPFGLPEGMK